MTDKPVALVTGANHGIGLQVAKDLAANGFIALVGSRDLPRGSTAAQEIGADAVAIQLDVTDETSISAAAARIRTEFGRLDVLVNNAGISQTSRRPGETLAEFNTTNLTSNVDLNELRAVFETNVFGVVAVFQAMLPLLREAPGSTYRQRVERSGIADHALQPRLPLPRRIPPDVQRIQNRSERNDRFHGNRTRGNRHQGQCRLTRADQDLPQQLRRS